MVATPNKLPHHAQPTVVTLKFPHGIHIQLLRRPAPMLVAYAKGAAFRSVQPWQLPGASAVEWEEAESVLRAEFARPKFAHRLINNVADALT